MITKEMQKQFEHDCLLRNLGLHNIIAWISENIIPVDVFNEEKLFNWINSNRDPEDVFDDIRLSCWAEDNDFVREKKKKGKKGKL